MRSKTKHIFLVALVICAVTFLLVACSNTDSGIKGGTEPERIVLTGKYYLSGTPVDVQNIVVTEGYAEFLPNFRITSYIYGIPYTGLYNFGKPQGSTSTGQYFYYGDETLGILWDGDSELTYWVYGGNTLQSFNFTYHIGDNSYVRPDEKTAVGIPTSGGSLIYNGQEQTASILGNDYYTASSETGTNVGEYSVTLTLKDTENSAWGNTDNTEPLTLKWYIVKATVAQPTLPTQSISYDGNLKTCNIEKSSTYTIAGNTAVEAGNYTATIELNDTENYEWSNGGTSPHTINWTIKKMQVVRPSQTTQSFIYNGNEKTYNITENTNYTVAGNTAINAGNYTATVTLNDTDNCEWSSVNSYNGLKTDIISINWSIAKAEIERPSRPTQNVFIYDTTEQTFAVNANDLYTATGTTGMYAGEYTATISINDSINYVWNSFEWGDSYSNSEPIEFNWYIEKCQLAVPTAEMTAFVFDGTQKTLQVAESTLYTISDNTQTRVGSYSAKVTLIDANNYEWVASYYVWAKISWSITVSNFSQSESKPIVLSQSTGDFAVNQNGTWFNFTIESETAVAFSVFEKPIDAFDNSDIRAEVYSNNGTINVNDSGKGIFSAGQYFVKIYNYSYGTAYGEFLADNLTNVESLLLGESTGTKTVGGGGVWYKLTLANQTAVKFDINKESGQQLGIEIFNSNTLNLLLSSYNDYDSDISAVLDVGTYYILLRSMDVFGNISSGSLTVRNNQIIINSSTGEVSVDHSCGTWYSFKIDEETSLTFMLESSTFGTKYADIYASNNLNNNLFIMSNNSSQTKTLSAGTYFVKLSHNFYRNELLIFSIVAV